MEWISRNCKLIAKSPSDTVTIELKRFLAVEGQDEVYFLNALLNKMNIEGVEVQEIRGIDNLRNKIPVLIRTPGFSDVEMFGIIRDADSNVQSAFQSVRDLLVREELLKPNGLSTITSQFSQGNPRVGIFIMPNNSSEGMIENLCLESVKNEPIMQCVNNLFKCVNNKIDELERPRNLAKSKVQVFLATRPKLVCSVGLAAAKGYWNFDSKEFSELKTFLNNLR